MAHAAKGAIMVDGQYHGCKLVAATDADTKQVCDLEVQFKNGAVGQGLASAALAAWRTALARHSFVVPESLVSQGWQTSKPFGAPYQVMSLMSPGHHVDRCCNEAKDWKDIE